MGCLAVPVVLLMILSVYTTVQALQSGRIVPFAEVSGSPEWTAETLRGESIGGWWSEDRIVQISRGGLTAVATDDGAELWQLETDARVCGMAEEASDGVGVVLLDGDHVDPEPLLGQEDDPEHSCEDVLAVDLEDGTELWRSGPLLEGGDAEERYREELDVSLHEGGVVVRVDGELRGLDLADGSQSWSRDELTADGGSCPAVDLATRDAGQAVAVADCGPGDRISVHVLDAGSGQDTSSFTFDRGAHETGDEPASTVLLNTDPAVVRLDLGHRRGPERDHDPDVTESGADDPHWEQILVFDGSGDLVSSMEDRKGALKDLDEEGPRTLFDGDHVHMSTRDTGCTSRLYTHDLSTGQELWETSMRGDGHQAVAVQEERLLAIRGGGPEDAKCQFLTSPRDWQFYVLDTGTGDAQPLSSQISQFEQPEADQVWWDGERLFFVEPVEDPEETASVVAL